MHGVLLSLEGNAKVRSRAADTMNFTEGALWSENGAGTNAIGTALAADHAVQIFATEHFNEVVHPSGSARPLRMTSEQLTADLYGDAGQPNSVRVEMWRLRKLLGPWIDTQPYRLSMDVESDVGRIKGLLDRGAVRQAVECYEGLLLPRSEAPGVVREREAVDGWVRQAVMTADDDKALWGWVQSTSGAGDLAAWKRLLAALDFRDPRRSLAAARLKSLRAAYA
jgi:hypothetical protein